MDVSFPSISAAPLPFASQISGHAKFLITADGSLVIKPALLLEPKFYQTLLREPALAPLHPFTPRFLGTLKLKGPVDELTNGLAVGIAVTPIEGGNKDESFMGQGQLEDASYFL
jgi:1D-myo-inositol-tetrakisphosphate 5-kinase/inositol-polyphosphate multikinase